MPLEGRAAAGEQPRIARVSVTAPPFEGWWIVTLDAPPRGRELEVADELRRFGARALQRQGNHVVARFPATSRASPATLAERLRAVGCGLIGAPRWQSYAEWRRERFDEAGGPRRIGRRIVVVPDPPDDPLEPGAGAEPGDALVVRLVPGLAFGGAEHATTRACLGLLEDRPLAGAYALDVGTGSGVLAITMVALGARQVVALEADLLAADEARTNVRRNGLDGRVEVRSLALWPGAAPPGSPFDAVVANLEGAHLLPLVPTLVGALAPGGWLLLSGLVVDERLEALSALAAAGATRLVDEQIDGAWWSAVLERAVN